MSHRLTALALLLLPGLAAAGPLLCVSPDGARLAAVNADTSTVAIIDLAGRKTLHEVAIGSRAEAAAWVNNRVLAVNIYHQWKVALIDTHTGEELEGIDLDGQACGLAVTRDGKTAYVAHDDKEGKVSVIDLEGGKVTKKLPAGVFPGAVSLAPDERTLYVTERKAGVLAIDLSSGEAAPITGGHAARHYLRPKAMEILLQELTLDGYMLAGFALFALLARVLFWPARPTPGQRLPYAAVAVILVGAVAVPASWPHAVAAWGWLGSLRQADVLSIAHYCIVWYVLIVQVLVLVGWWRGWRWVRGFWLRFMHLLCIVIVAGQALNGWECPVTTWDRDLRGGDLANLDGSWPLAHLANRALYTPVPDLTPYLRGYALFACLVFLSWILVRPEVGPPPQATGSETPVQSG